MLEVEAVIQGQPQLCNNFWASLGYRQHCEQNRTYKTFPLLRFCLCHQVLPTQGKPFYSPPSPIQLPCPPVLQLQLLVVQLSKACEGWGQRSSVAKPTEQYTAIKRSFQPGSWLDRKMACCPNRSGEPQHPCKKSA